jgi:putative hemolysin
MLGAGICWTSLGEAMIKNYFRKLVPQFWAQRFQNSESLYLFQPGLVGKKDRMAANLPVFRAPPLFELSMSAKSNDRYNMSFAQSLEELREAQRLRYSVFTQEYQATITSRLAGVDEDLFDAYCNHLIVRDRVSQEVVGTYRILDPHQAKRLKGYYSETEFFITRLNDLRGSMVELGRSCVHPDHRNGSVIMLLWSGIARYMQHFEFNNLIGCASVSMRDGGRTAASLWDMLEKKALAPSELMGFPRHPLPLERLEREANVEEPPLIKGYVRIGAKVCSPPSWDPDFNTADFLMLLNLNTMNPKYARHFGIRSSTN